MGIDYSAFGTPPGIPDPAPWGMLYQSPLYGPGVQTAPGQAPDPSIAAAYGMLGLDPSALQMPTPPVSPFPQQQPQPAAPSAPGFGAGAAPFSFAGPGSNVVNPAQIAPPAQPPMTGPQPAVAAAPPPLATDISSSNAAADMAKPIGIGSYQMPRAGAPDDYEPDDATPANATPTQGRAPAAAPLSFGGPPSPGVGDRMSLAGKGFLGNMSGGPVGALLGGLGALVTGKPTDAGTIAQQGHTATAQALLSKGADLPTVQAAVNNPTLMTALIQQYYGKDKYKVVQTGEDGLGRKTFAMFNEADGTVKPIGGAAAGSAGDNGGGGLGDMNKTGAAYLATVPKQQANIIQQMVEGKIAPPSSFALAKPYWQAMLSAARQYDPSFDETTWKSRAKMATDVGASSNSSVGGILSNGKSAFEHLANLSDKAVDLNNYNGPDIPGGAVIASTGNYLGNGPLANSKQTAKVTAFSDNAQKYGAEATKFYSGSGGGVEERLLALKTLDPQHSSANAQAAYLETEKQLMLGRLKQKEDQIRDVMGQDYLDRHPVMTPDFQKTVSRIDANVAKLRGQQAAPAAAAAPGLPQGWSVQVH